MMNYEDMVLRENIMRRVRFIYSVKNNALAFVAKFAVLVFFIVAGSFLVSVPNIINNMPSIFEIGNFVNFFMLAFLKTGLIIQAISLGTIAAIFYIVRDIVKTFRGGSQQLASV